MGQRIAIIGAGPAGLMAAEVLSQYAYEVQVFEQKPSAARKFLMAGKTGLNISHAEDIEQFVQRYDQVDWLAPWVRQFNAVWIQQWMQDLGIASYVGTSGRIFPKEMKAAPLLRAWLARLNQSGVKFHYRHQVLDLTDKTLTVLDQKTAQQRSETFDAVILACGAVSWSQLGSDGAWQKWFQPDNIQNFQPSNAGVERSWSQFMQPIFGQPLKRVAAWVDASPASMGDIVITHYGLESGLIYKWGRALRQQQRDGQTLQFTLDLLPDVSVAELAHKLSASKKQSMSNVWRKAGLDAAKANLVREIVPKALWSQPQQLAEQIKHLHLSFKGFRPIEEAISCAGGMKRELFDATLGLKQQPGVFACGEMLDWDAPTGGYLLTACFATGRIAGIGAHQYLKSSA